MKTTYPPLSLIVQWRSEGIPPEIIHARCAAFDRAIRRNDRKCAICGEKYHARGYCAKHYQQWYVRNR